MMTEDEYQFLIGQKLECLHFLLPADVHEVHEKTKSHEVRYQLSLIEFHHVSISPNMSRFFDVTYSEKGAVFGLIERTFIVAILILSF